MFLSCLCGSELKHFAGIDRHVFLSCLCGSEQQLVVLDAALIFLSCLCGSEHPPAPVGVYFELPMRQ